ncbi:intradiol ring-cleavage dioxygenase [Variovorax paradoxus]|uniref:Catechol 1,2-dioxygenase n=1 Tax=Variovorax paradoxus TaxID=34073 RepID=A0A0H2LU27_VARPD|nr:intradiol ring-cleavage dioxygenase [Variovorax paradoxus]KLN53753.1 catechol 1,2-dioxygenase [Variovorax paradoxus]
MTTHDRKPGAVGRRGLLAAIGAAGLCAAAPSSAAAARALPLTAQATEGPYYIDAAKLRSDITEGLAGVPLEVRFTVLDTAGKPLRGLRMDLWHCDAQGRYSGFGEQGEDRSLSFEGRTFLRGSQHADRTGAVAFATIYPGWYAGRTTHIHFKVLNGARTVLTSQFFLPDALSEYLYAQVAGYKRARLRDTLNSTDGIALKAGHTVVGAVREERQRYVATLTLVVDPASSPAAEHPPGPGPNRDAPASGFPGPGEGPPQPSAPEGEARTRAIVPRRA